MTVSNYANETKKLTILLSEEAMTLLLSRGPLAPSILVQGGLQRLRPRKKRMRIIRRHPILLKWNEHTRRDISDALRGCDWSYFYPVSIGFTPGLNPLPTRPPFDEELEHYPVVLLVGVNAASLAAEKALSFARSCKAALVESGIDNVEVELQDASFHYLVDPRLERQERPVCSSWGNYFTAQQDGGAESIRKTTAELSQESYGIVNRHVALADVMAPRKNYKRMEKHWYPLGLDHGLSLNLKTLRAAGAIFRQEREQLESRAAGELDPNQKLWVNTRLSLFSQLEKSSTAKDTAKPTDKYGEIFVGSIFASPAMSQSPRPYSNEFHGLGPDNSLDMLPRVPVSMRIMGVRPHDESRKAFLVGMRGNEMSFGVVTEIEAVLRHKSDDVLSIAQVTISYELDNRRRPVAATVGDSGMCLFDWQRRAVGMVDGAQMENNPVKKNSGGFYALFSTPMEWIFEDNQEFTGRALSLV